MRSVALSLILAFASLAFAAPTQPDDRTTVTLNPDLDPVRFHKPRLIFPYEIVLSLDLTFVTKAYIWLLG